MQTVPEQGLTEMSPSAYMLQDKKVCTEAPSAQKVVVVQPLSRVRLCGPVDCGAPWTVALHGLWRPRFPCPSPSPGVCSHVPRVGDATQPSHPLLSPSLALSSSQHQGLFQ